MSSLGITNMPAVSLASSVAGGQQAQPGKDSAKAAAASQDFRNNMQAKASRAIEDVNETSLHADRDADGLYLPDHPENDPEEQANGQQKKGSDQSKSKAQRTASLDAMVGTRLDLDA